MNVLRVSQMALRVCGVLALILGPLVAFEAGLSGLVPVHMLLGILAVIAALVIGGVAIQAPTTRVLALITIVAALAQAGAGMTLAGGGASVGVLVVHLLLGLAVLGLGEVAGARFLRARVVTSG